MSADHPTERSSPASAAGLPGAKAAPTPTTERCSGCGLPMTRRGLQGECLRCALRHALADDAEEGKDGPAEARGDRQPAASEVIAAVRRYGHFEVAAGADARRLSGERAAMTPSPGLARGERGGS